MHARHYSPALGCFLQPDPDRSEANLYAYAANNPVTEIDPDGTCFIVCQLFVGAVIDSIVSMTIQSSMPTLGASRHRLWLECRFGRPIYPGWVPRLTLQSRPESPKAMRKH
jgi:hypothetical protein